VYILCWRTLVYRIDNTQQDAHDKSCIAEDRTLQYTYIIFHLSYLQVLIRMFECPKRSQYLLPPIYVCINGHSICENCKHQTAFCPTCRMAFTNTRSVVLEKISTYMQFPCVYWRSGCNEIMSSENINEHLPLCRFRKYFCPLQCPVKIWERRTCWTLAARTRYLAMGHLMSSWWIMTSGKLALI
jgi:hypothetical protein